jgi:hypothetical protein
VVVAVVRVVAVSAAAAVGVVGVVVWVAAVVVAVAVVKGEAMAVTSTLGRIVMRTSLSRTQWTQTRSVAKLGLLPSTCVLVFDVVYGGRGRGWGVEGGGMDTLHCVAPHGHWRFYRATCLQIADCRGDTRA